MTGADGLDGSGGALGGRESNRAGDRASDGESAQGSGGGGDRAGHDGSRRGFGRWTGVAAGAALIGVFTVLARITGFGRIFVFSQTVGTDCLADVYQSANTIPNIIFELVAGGVLASLVVPLLARDAESGPGGAARVSRTASALLTWAVVLLVPVTVVVVIAADPLAMLVLGEKVRQCPGAEHVAASMLRVFAPQIVLYGVGIVLTGVLQAHRRFVGPALGPLLSSLTVIGAYLLYAVLAGPARAALGSLSQAEELVLSLGTTAGVVVLTLPLLAWLRPTGIRLRPKLRFDEEVGGRARRLGAAGLIVLLAQQVAVAVTLRLSNDTGAGYAATYLYAQTIYLLPWAVLAVPVATAVYPRLSAAADAGDSLAYAARLGGALRGVLLLGSLGAVLLISTAPQLAAVFLSSSGGAADSPVPAQALASGIVAFSPGLLGYGLVALLTRALFARGANRRATLATSLGWLVVVVADLVFVQLLPVGSRVAALAWGNSVGMTVAGVALLFSCAGGLGRGTWKLVLRTSWTGLLAGSASLVAGLLVSRLDRGPGSLAAVAQGMLVGVVVLTVFGVVSALGERDAVRALTAKLRTRSSRSGSGNG